ncbi:hypothetical protein Adi01nite_01260 [Amorphoplanes digitatis]|uniref:DUF2750 domain-containing protein n=1 Tax=Actinoplanes digitatis TaxID=1868 RepID=A0A7W7HVL5_9ACTN|nr:DUF2750 domain-containing protein [Actinoplanes digitatis]MBB4761604.1 hypothetical protein [Actinoplanes digitatis]BFE70164.1 hypothetical protein GCM10020092_034650 [Actinoplanes digitatis]GID90714.1 hypothetical protein Adi01nite_01260 [Actinoplanes digitatis]
MARDDISRGEAERLRRLDEAARVTRTFEVIADKGALWVWGDEDEILFTEDARRRTLLPIWPHATVARLENEGDVDGEHAIRIPADVFLRDWLPQLREDDADIAVFPVEEHNATVLTLDEFRARMTAALRMN